MAGEQQKVEWQKLIDVALTAPGSTGNVYNRFYDYKPSHKGPFDFATPR
jgi:hypothetical protein